MPVSPLPFPALRQVLNKSLQVDCRKSTNYPMPFAFHFAARFLCLGVRTVSVCQLTVRRHFQHLHSSNQCRCSTIQDFQALRGGLESVPLEPVGPKASSVKNSLSKAVWPTVLLSAEKCQHASTVQSQYNRPTDYQTHA